MSVDLFLEMKENGYVRVQRHPRLPLSILNYTPKAVFEEVWNDVTKNCRGLIITATGKVMSRPFSKFFNYGQEGAPDVPLDEPVVVTDKLDGSLGILYHEGDDNYAIATRGSFTSDQARHATEVLNSRYPMWVPDPEFTYLFEIIYPENRVVCDYDTADDIFLLATLNTETGLPDADKSSSPWRGPIVGTFHYSTFGEALVAEPRPNAEGLVIYIPRLNERVKVKQDDYVKLHRIVTGLTARTVWQAIVDGIPFSTFIEPIPDEFHRWVWETWSGIESAVILEVEGAYSTYGNIIESLPKGFTRKDFALRAKEEQISGLLFMIHDRRSIRSEVLKNSRPPAFFTPTGRVQTEDTA